MSCQYVSNLILCQYKNTLFDSILFFYFVLAKANFGMPVQKIVFCTGMRIGIFMMAHLCLPIFADPLPMPVNHVKPPLPHAMAAPPFPFRSRYPEVSELERALNHQIPPPRASLGAFHICFPVLPSRLLSCGKC